MSPRYKLCRAIETAFRFLALIGHRSKLSDPTPPGLIGWRSRLLHIGIAFGWMSVGPCYWDTVRWHFRHGILGYWGPADYRNPRKWFGRA